MMVSSPRSAKVLQRLVEYLAPLPQLDAKQHESAAVDVPPLAYPRHFQSVGDVGGGQHFGVDHRVDAYLLEELLVLGLQVFVVVDAGHGLLGTEGVGDGAGRNIGGLLGGDAHEEVGLVGTGVLEYADAGGQGVVGHDVVLADAFQLLFVGIDEHAVLVLPRQQLRQMGSYGTCAYYYNLHTLLCLNCFFDTFHVESDEVLQLGHLTVFHKVVGGQAHPGHLHGVAVVA